MTKEKAWAGKAWAERVQYRLEKEWFSPVSIHGKYMAVGEEIPSHRKRL